jgi:hypothetical protein
MPKSSSITSGDPSKTERHSREEQQTHRELSPAKYCSARKLGRKK